MKNSLFILLLAVTAGLFTSSCSKKNVFPNMKTIPGAWHWFSTDGGIADNIHDTPASTGQNIALMLMSDNNYIFYTNGVATSQGTYTLHTGISIVDHQDKQVIDFSGERDLDMMIENMTRSRMELSDNAYDGVTSVYIK